MSRRDSSARPDAPPGRLGAVLARLGEHAAAVVRIARWEATRSAGVVDRRTAALGVVALLLTGGIVGATAATGGVSLDRGIYRVGIDAESPYRPVVNDTPSLAAKSPDASELHPEGELDLLVDDGRVWAADSRKGEAALSTFRGAVQSYNDRRLAADDNRSAAFPVFVNLRYVKRPDVTASSGASGGAAEGSSSGGTSAEGSSSGGTSAEGSSGGSGGVDSRSALGDSGAGGGSDDDGRLAVPDVGGGGGIFATPTSGSPASISPPFPFASLVLAFAFLVPMNFVSQAYGGTILNERINRRGELLLVAPVSPGDIVAGKTLPYLLGALAITVLVALAVGGGPVSVASVVPVALLFLAATFVGGMFARSFKELTFVSVAISVFLTSYTFVPAIFTNVTPIALISPLTLVVRDLQGAAVSLGEYAFATGPFYVSSAVLFLLGAGVYREEDMFTQRPVPLKFLDALDSRITGARSMVALGALSIPFVFIAELLAVALLFVLPVDLSIPVMLVAVAAIEELAKSLGVYAGFAKGRFAPTPRTAVVLGSLSGFGFFVGEKFTAVVQLVGLPRIELGAAAFGPAGIGIGVLPAAGLLLAPLALHAVSTSVAALGARGGRVPYVGGLIAAIAVHAAYNLAVVSTLG